MKLLMPFFVGGFPDERTFLRLLLAAQGAGADMLEVGIPFSDPVADGPVVQRASRMALSRGVTPASVAAALHGAGLRVPVVLLTYLNPLLRMRDLGGASAVVVPDLPPEEGGGISGCLRAKGADLAYCLSVEAPPERVRRVARASRGFVYLVAATGTTGVRSRLDPRLPALCGAVRRETDVPCLAGFGIGTPALAREAARHADGVIVGSALVAEALRGGRDMVSRVAARIASFRRVLS